MQLAQRRQPLRPKIAGNHQHRMRAPLTEAVRQHRTVRRDDGLGLQGLLEAPEAAAQGFSAAAVVNAVFAAKSLKEPPRGS
jgi:hypothetical protein